jgi:hypothetical protein
MLPFNIGNITSLLTFFIDLVTWFLVGITVSAGSGLYSGICFSSITDSR